LRKLSKVLDKINPEIINQQLEIMKELNLKLTLDETNLILTSLGQLPYNQVKQLVDKVRAQGMQQVQEANAVQHPEATLQNEKELAEVVSEQSMN
jgi:hypothetical protein